MFDKLIHEINTKSRALSPDEEVALYKRYKAGDEEAGHELVKCHYKLSLVLSLQHVKHGGKLEDLFQEGVQGLYKALERFEEGKNARFATYATWWVNSYIQDHMRQHNRQVDVPSHVVDQLSKLSSTTEAFVAREHREPSDKELGELLTLADHKVAKLRDLLQPSVQLDWQVEGESGTADIKDVIEDVHQETARDYAIRLSDIEQLTHFVSKRLTGQEREVLSHRFGLGGRSELTLEMTGKALKLSTARVQQIERIAIDKLQKAMISA